MFERYTLERHGDTYTVNLFLNRSLEEFATEPGRREPRNRQRVAQNVRQFVRQKFPDLRLTTARVMFGTVLVSTLPLGGVALAEGEAGTTTTPTETTTTSTGGTTAGDTTTGGTTTGGTATGETTTGGTTTGGTTTGETTTGGTTTGGTTTGGTTPGDATTGGTTPGDATTGGTTPGDATTGGTTPGDATTGGTPPGDATPGGTTPGDTTTTPPTTTPPTAPAAPAAPVLTDIGGSYAYDAIAALSAGGVITGYTDGSFRPTATMTRQEFAVVLAKSLRLEIDKTVTTTPFKDVSPWAAPYVSALAEEGLVSGFSETEFGANSPVTREQLAMFYVRALDMEEAALDLNIQPTFTDSENISAWAAPHVGFAKSIGLLQGIPNDDGTFSFDPTGKAQRQQVAIVANKFYSDYDRYHSAGLALATPATTPDTGTTPPATPAPDTTTPTPAPDTDATTPATPAPDTTTAPTTGTDTTPDATPAPDTTATAPDATPAPTTTDTTTSPGTVATSPDSPVITPTPDTTAANPDAVSGDIDRA